MPDAQVIPIGEGRGDGRSRRTPPAAADSTVAPIGSAQESGTTPESAQESVASESELERKVASGLAFLRRRLAGDYEVDEFGFDADLNDAVLMAALRPLYDKWFRVQVRGLERVPSEGGA